MVYINLKTTKECDQNEIQGLHKDVVAKVKPKDH